MKRATRFPELWHCVYWFPSNTFMGEEPSEYDMQAHQVGDTLILESTPTEDGSYMLVRLNVRDDLAMGNWYEVTAPNGEFKGAQYSGAGQLIVNTTTYFMEGKWAGAGYDHKLKKMRIYSGNWEIRPIKKLRITHG